MAASDYRLCDKCGCKAFYDSDLSYERGENDYGEVPYREAGEPQYGDPEIEKRCAMRLGNLGDWAVLCADCAKTYKTQIVLIEQEQSC